MRHPPSHSVVITMAMVVALAGCGGGGGGGESKAGSEGSERSAERTSPTAAPARIDLSKPIPGGSLYGTPRPPLENTGDDYVAIFESLVANLRWISENPDPGLIADVFVPGTPGHDERVPAYQYLVDNGYRFADEGYLLISVDVVDTQPGVASLRVVQQLEFERVVDSAGQQVGDRRPHGQPETMDFLLAQDPGGTWRIAGGGHPDDAEVEL